MIINEKNFERAYNDYFEIVCRFLNSYTHDRHAIEEVVQDIFVKLWEEYQGKEIHFIKTYLYNSARNRMLNYIRNEERHSFLLEKWAKIELESKGAADCIDRDEFFLLLQEAINTLPEKCKDIYVMSREEQLSYKEIATIRNISVKTVENQMGKALRKIREYILMNSGYSASILLLIQSFTD